MSTRNAAPINSAGHVTRAQRRAAARAEERMRQGSRGGVPGWQIFVGALVIAGAIVAFAGVMMAGTFGSHPAAGPVARPLTNPAALDPAPSLLKVGTTAPNFSLTDGMDMRYSLAAERGHPVLLEFFAVWCPVCHRETSVIHRLAQRFETKGVRTLAVLANPYGKNYETSGGKDLSLAALGDLVWYGRTYHANYPLLVDPRFKTVNAYGIGAYPGLYVIGKDGKILFSSSGYQQYSSLASRLEQALQQKG